jgi:arylsulfatase A-like enzyme
MDIYPTLAAAAGVPPRATLPLDGRNLWPAVAAGKTEPREDLFFTVEVPETRYLAVHHGEWKLVRLVSRTGGKVQDLLFRIDRDPNETTDLAAENAKLVGDLAGRIEKWQALHPRDGTGMAHNEPRAGWKAPAQWAEAASQ